MEERLDFPLETMDYLDGSPLIETDAGGESITSTVILAVSSLTDTAPDDLPPLFETVDPDALDALFQQPRSAGHVAFQYYGHRIEVNADNVIRVYSGDA